MCIGIPTATVAYKPIQNLAQIIQKVGENMKLRNEIRENNQKTNDKFSKPKFNHINNYTKQQFLNTQVKSTHLKYPG